MKNKLFFLAIIGCCFFLTSCEKDLLSPDDLHTTYIDEPIVLKVSEPVSARVVSEEEFIFDLSFTPLVQSGEYNDFELTYQTSSSCDEDVWVFNFRTLTWDQIGFTPPPGIMCLCVITEHGHLFSARGFRASNYLSLERQIKVRGHVWPRTVLALKINPEYSAVPIFLGKVNNFDGLAYDGQSFWVSSNLVDKIYNVSSGGIILKEFVSPSEWPSGLAYDGQNLWLSDGSNQIFKLTQSGTVQSQFTVPTDYPGALAWGNGKLWLLESEHPLVWAFGMSLIFGIDPVASCQTGLAVVTDTFQSPGERGMGIAWDGTHLLVATESIYGQDDKLYKLTTTGEVVQSYDLPVRFIEGIVWNGEVLWMLCGGPKDLMSRDMAIAGFKLR